jgi:hypothetical protein
MDYDFELLFPNLEVLYNVRKLTSRLEREIFLEEYNNSFPTFPLHSQIQPPPESPINQPLLPSAKSRVQSAAEENFQTLMLRRPRVENLFATSGQSWLSNSSINLPTNGNPQMTFDSSKMHFSFSPQLWNLGAPKPKVKVISFNPLNGSELTTKHLLKKLMAEKENVTNFQSK